MRFKSAHRAMITVFAAAALTFAATGVAAQAQTTPAPILSLQALQTLLDKSAGQTTLPPLVVPLSSMNLEGTNIALNHGCFEDPSMKNPIAQRPSNAVCTCGDPRGTSSTVLFGDSQAGAWIAAMSAIAANDHVKLVVFALAGCQMASVDTWAGFGLPAAKACSAFRAWPLRQIALLHPTSIVLAYYVEPAYSDFSQHAIAPATYTNAVITTLRALKGATRHVVFFGRIPHLSFDPPNCLAAHPTAIDRCGVASALAIDPAVSTTMTSAAGATGVSILSLLPFTCSAQACPVVANNTVMYRDQFHLARHYTLEIVPPLAQALHALGVR